MKVLLFDFAGVISIQDFGQNPQLGLNRWLLNKLAALTSKQVAAIYTNSTYLTEDPELMAVLRSVFQEFFLASQLGLAKSDPASYLALAKKLNCQPDEIFFTDDSSQNVIAAQQVGVTAVLYQNNQQLWTDISKFLGINSKD